MTGLLPFIERFLKLLKIQLVSKMKPAFFCSEIFFLRVSQREKRAE